MMLNPQVAKHTRTRTMFWLGLAGVVLFAASGAPAQEAIVIGHDCTNLSKVPPYWTDQAKAAFRLSYGHTSHGSQIVTGMDLIKQPPGSLYWWDYDGTVGGLSLHDYTPPGDLGSPDRYTWEVQTRAMLDAPGNNRNCVMWSWCGQADATPAEIQIYLNLMTGLIADYPEVTFIYMTGHLNGTGEEGNLHQRNNQIRNHVIATGGVLFDFADIESYDPDGDHFLDLYADDGCYYSGGNWADEWCAAHPGSDLCADCDCAHSRPLNCNLKGRAFWWMMARLAGWNGQTLTASSVLDHGGTELSLDLTDNNVEPRAAGVRKIAVQVAEPVGSVAAEVSCLNHPYGGSLTVTPSGTTVTIVFSEPLPDQDCCEITLSGDVTAAFTVRPLKGDVDRGGLVTPGDASVIKPHFGQTPGNATAVYDFDCSGLVTPGDFSQIKPLFGHAAPECP